MDSRWVVEFSNTFVGTHNEFRYGVKDDPALYKVIRDAVEGKYPIRFWWQGKPVYNPCSEFSGQVVYRAEPEPGAKPQPTQ